MGRNNKNIERELLDLKAQNQFLKNLCKEKDGYFLEMISDGLRHGSSVAAKHMADRKKYLNRK